MTLKEFHEFPNKYIHVLLDIYQKILKFDT